ncbi:glutaredoxin domain-containing protein [Enemella sp. A6]|uniref:glutaredoxin domain-containing protein n=1 Tax=Enemella sp. A6 TaxID=3440152 RepID=UPI003EBC6248
MRKLLKLPALLPALFAFAAVMFLLWAIVEPDLIKPVVAVVFGFLAVRTFANVAIRSRPVAGVDEHLARGGAVVFWRPGCPYCAALIRALGSELRHVPYWVNVWDEPEASERLRGYNDGNETVPTLVTSEGHVVATDTAAAAEIIRAATPSS